MTAPLPMILTCPACSARHIDEGEFATKVHHTHSCQSCGLTWRPAVEPTVGVRFLPGFKSADEPSGDEQIAQLTSERDAAREELEKYRAAYNRNVDAAIKLAEQRDAMRAVVEAAQAFRFAWVTGAWAEPFVEFCKAVDALARLKTPEHPPRVTPEDYGPIVDALNAVKQADATLQRLTTLQRLKTSTSPEGSMGSADRETVGAADAPKASAPSAADASPQPSGAGGFNTTPCIRCGGTGEYRTGCVGSTPWKCKACDGSGIEPSGAIAEGADLGPDPDGDDMCDPEQHVWRAEPGKVSCSRCGIEKLPGIVARDEKIASLESRLREAERHQNSNGAVAVRLAKERDAALARVAELETLCRHALDIAGHLDGDLAYAIRREAIEAALTPAAEKGREP